jgi:hypothetical protein
MLLIPTKTLLLVAAAVWLAAGVSVCSVGVSAMIGWTIPVAVGFAIVFVLFLGMFISISNKHIRRIKGYTEKLTGIYKFFDVKSYVTIAVMIGLGLTVRLSGLVPDPAIAAFYSGLGLALLTAAVYYVATYVGCCDGLIPKEAPSAQ